MTDFNFSVIISIIMVSMILILALSIRLQLTVKAGKVTKFCGKYALSAYTKPGKVILGDRIVDASSMEILRVRGNSMKDYGIRSNNQVYVCPYKNDLDKENIDTHPVMVFTITDHNILDSMYKLRKFVSYVDLHEVDWHQVYLLHEPGTRIKIGEDVFVKRCLEKAQNEEIRNLDRCILSETYNEVSGEYEYSLHPISNLYGKVCYVK